MDTHMEVWNRSAVYLLWTPVLVPAGVPVLFPEQGHRLALHQVPLGRNSTVALHPVEHEGPLGSVG